MSCLYGYPERERRRSSWELNRRLANVSSLLWCILGDFNDILYASDKQVSNLQPQWLMEGFKKVIEECQLAEIDLVGGKYIWECSQGTTSWVRERLDRAYAVRSWWSKFPLCQLKVLHTGVSNHEPILLNLVCVDISIKGSGFDLRHVA